MASWFTQSTGFDLNSAFDTLTETVQTVKESVQEAIPTEHKDLLAKITLNTDEMISEREQYRQEASRKESAKDRLNKVLPWGTLDPERQILVEECKESILELSGREETFFGPYEMPLLNVQLETTESDDEKSIEEQQEESEDKKDVDDGVAEDTPTEVSKGGNNKIIPKLVHMAPPEESLEMLAKLQPLPQLLEDFDLEVHVGLIQSVMKEDPELVEMQAYFSGGGARERTFWRNYFFHCAFVRYKTGLSLDEIWSYSDESNTASPVEDAPAEDAGGVDEVSPAIDDGNEETAAALEGSGPNEADSQNNNDPSSATADSTVDMNGDGTNADDSSFTELSELTQRNGFEMIEQDVDGIEDPELDELEAEIARELEDM